MKDKEFFAALEQIEYEKGISKEELVTLIEKAVIEALKKHHEEALDYHVRLDRQNMRIEAFAKKTVREKVKDAKREITLEQALKSKPDAKEGDEWLVPVDAEDIARIAAQTAKQVIIQKIRENEKEKIFQEFRGREMTVILGEVYRLKEENVYFLLNNKVEGILPPREQIPREVYRTGDIFKVFILKTEISPQGPRVLLSRTHPGLLRQLFNQEVPEVREKVVEIKDVVREPGVRSKVSVLSRNPRVDPIGSCVGVKGARIQMIVNALSGERMDLILYSEDPAEYITHALSPAKLGKIELDKDKREAFVTMDDDQLSLAIGKAGVNVKLAARLTNFHIDIKSFRERETEKRLAENLEEILPGIKERLREKGYLSKMVNLRDEEWHRIVSPEEWAKIEKLLKEKHESKDK
ncbi:MAG TPA: transcription termination factor NusA [bacterium]|nr:transcription termination factor NusA [bacterium]